MLGNTISHSILGANGEGGRSSSAWDMAVAFNSADSSITTRQLMSEFDYLYKYDPQKRAYVSRGNLGEDTAAVSENRPALVLLQSENDSATGQIFPIGQGVIDVAALHFHWQKVPVPGHHGEKVSENEFYTHTPGNNQYLVNYHVVPLGETSPPSGLRATENRAFEANIKQNHPDFSFYTSEHNDGHEKSSVTMGNTLPVMSIHRREKNSGGSGNLSIAVTPACPIGSSACPRTLSGVMEDCGAITPSPCLARSFAWNSRLAQAALWLFPSRGPLQSPPICSS